MREDLNVVVPEEDLAVWKRVAPVFSNWAFMRPHATWFSGVASRAGPDRMDKLTRSRPALKLAPLIAGFCRTQLGRLVVLS